MFYVDGLTVVFAFAGIFAAKVFGFSLNEMVLMFAIAVNFTCGVGALLVVGLMINLDLFCNKSFFSLSHDFWFRRFIVT